MTRTDSETDTTSIPAADSAPVAGEMGEEPKPHALPSRGLLSFYDRLRGRIEQRLERGGKIGRQAAAALLLVPDVFIMLVRLALDKEVPTPTRALVASALAYFILPVDLLPEIVLGPVGYLDDLVLALAVLSEAFGTELEPYAAKYWSGAQSVRRVVGDVLEAAHGLIGADVYERLKGLLAKRGIDLDELSPAEVAPEPDALPEL